MNFDFDLTPPRERIEPSHSASSIAAVPSSPAAVPKRKKTPAEPIRPEAPAFEEKLLEARKIDTQDGRFYECPDLHTGEVFYYPSVTTILKTYFNSSLAQWRGSVGNAEADRIFYEAGEKGTYVHKAFEDMLTGMTIYNVEPKGNGNGKPYRVIDDQYAYLQLWRLVQFMDAVQPVVKLSEVALFSHEHKYAGTVDLLLDIQPGSYRINGKNPVVVSGGLYVADIKTSNYFHPNYHWQTAAYAEALREQGIPVEGTMILHTKGKTRTGIEGFAGLLRERHEVAEDFENFLRVKAVYDIDAPEPKITQLPEFISLNSLIKK